MLRIQLAQQAFIDLDCRARLTPHDITSPRRPQLEGRIGLPTRQTLDCQWTFEADQALAQMTLQSPNIEADRRGAKMQP